MTVTRSIVGSVIASAIPFWKARAALDRALQRGPREGEGVCSLPVGSGRRGGGRSLDRAAATVWSRNVVTGARLHGIAPDPVDERDLVLCEVAEVGALPLGRTRAFTPSPARLAHRAAAGSRRRPPASPEVPDTATRRSNSGSDGLRHSSQWRCPSRPGSGLFRGRSWNGQRTARHGSSSAGLRVCRSCLISVSVRYVIIAGIGAAFRFERS